MRSRVLGALGALALQVALVLAALFMAAFDRGFYFSEYARLGVYESCGADAETLERATDITIDYLRGTAPDMSGEGVIDGVRRDIFGADERAHMQDVRELFKLALIVLLISGAVAIACLLLAGRQARGTAQGALIGMGAFLLIMAIAAIWCACDFEGAFLAMHGALFTNELWQMDARTQFMIRMFPQQFFADMGLRIALFTGVGMATEAFIIYMTGFGGRKGKDGIR